MHPNPFSRLNKVLSSGRNHSHYTENEPWWPPSSRLVLCAVCTKMLILLSEQSKELFLYKKPRACMSSHLVSKAHLISITSIYFSIVYLVFKSNKDLYITGICPVETIRMILRQASTWWINFISVFDLTACMYWNLQSSLDLNFSLTQPIICQECCQ